MSIGFCTRAVHTTLSTPGGFDPGTTVMSGLWSGSAEPMDPTELDDRDADTGAFLVPAEFFLSTAVEAEAGAQTSGSAAVETEEADNSDSKRSSAAASSAGVTDIPVVATETVTLALCVENTGFVKLFDDGKSTLASARYKRMSAALGLLCIHVENLDITNHVQYVIDLIAQHLTLLRQHTLPKSKQQITWYRYGSAACNCIRFEIVNRSLDLARRYICQYTLTPSSSSESDVVKTLQDSVADSVFLAQLLQWVSEEVATTWVDAQKDYARNAITELCTLAAVLKAHACWQFASMIAHKVERAQTASGTRTMQDEQAARMMDTAAAYFLQCRQLLSAVPPKLSMRCDGKLGYPDFQHDCRLQINADCSKVVLPTEEDKKADDRYQSKQWGQKARCQFLLAASSASAYAKNLGESVALKCAALNNGAYVGRGRTAQDHCLISGIPVPSNVSRVIGELADCPQPLYQSYKPFVLFSSLRITVPIVSSCESELVCEKSSLLRNLLALEKQCDCHVPSASEFV